jgi:hypothetical protein
LFLSGAVDLPGGEGYAEEGEKPDGRRNPFPYTDTDDTDKEANSGKRSQGRGDRDVMHVAEQRSRSLKEMKSSTKRLKTLQAEEPDMDEAGKSLYKKKTYQEANKKTSTNPQAFIWRRRKHHSLIWKTK